MIELCIVLVILVITLLICLITEYTKRRRIEEEWDNYFRSKDENEVIIESLVNDDIETRRIEALQRLQILNDEIDFQEKTLSNLNDEIQSKKIISENQTKLMIKNSEDLISTDKTIKEAQKILQDINNEIKSKQIEQETLKESHKTITTTIENYKNELNNLCQQHKQATKRLSEENIGRVMDFTTTDVQLTELLENLKLQYPQLKDIFSNAEWTKIWQPKFQAMTVDIKPTADKCGIYRIFTIDNNGSCRNYVGQAKKIRERWSQHIKAMLGVTANDNHKFYSNVKPFNAHFEIIEEVGEAKLNEREHYWIDYYNAVSDGYNTKI